MIWGSVTLVNRFFLVPTHIIGELVFARWLPWWRRFAAVPFTTLSFLLTFTDRTEVGDWAGHIGSALFLWNSFTAMRNRRNDRDMRKVEAAKAEQTDVQRAAWRREVAEATG